MRGIFYFLVLISLSACVDHNNNCDCNQFGHSYNGVRDSLGLVQIPSNFQLSNVTEWGSDYYCKWTDSSQLSLNVVMEKTVHVWKDSSRIDWDETTYIFPDQANCVIDPDTGPEDLLILVCNEDDCI